MVIEKPLEVGQPRRRVWCMAEEISLVDSGIYEFVNLPEEALGDGSEVIVMNSPCKLLFWSAKDEKLYDWSI